MDSSSLSTSDIISQSSSYDSGNSSMESTLESTLETIPDSNTTLTETLNDDIVINSVTIENNNDIDAICEVKDILSNRVNDEKYNYECVICLEPGNVIFNPLCDCKFYFHEQCYSNWLFKNDKSCIFCKKDLTNKVDVLLFHEDEDGILTEYLSQDRNNIIQSNIPVTRPRNPPIYSKNRIRDGQIFVLDENNPINHIERENVNNVHQQNRDSCDLIRLCVGTQRRRKITGFITCVGVFTFVFYVMIYNI